MMRYEIDELPDSYRIPYHSDKVAFIATMDGEMFHGLPGHDDLVDAYYGHIDLFVTYLGRLWRVTDYDAVAASLGYTSVSDR